MSTTLNLSEKEKILVEEALFTLKKKYPEIDFVFLTVAGSHIYGTKDESIDTDIDVRGAFVYPTEYILGLEKKSETIEFSDKIVDISIQEIGKFLSGVLSPNMNYIEQILSPIVVRTSTYHERMKKIAEMCFSKDLYEHVTGFSVHTWKHAEKERWSNPKRILYLYRDLLRGIILFRDKKFESNVKVLAELYDSEEVIKNVNKLIEMKKKSVELKNFGFECRNNLGELQLEIQRLKDFGVLNKKALLDKSYINRFILDIRKDYWKSLGL